MYLKIILLQCFQFSVFSFNKNKLYSNGPLIENFNYVHGRKDKPKGNIQGLETIKKQDTKV